MASDQTLPKSDESRPSNLPTKEIPGNYGVPLFGPIKDRYDYNYFEGHDEFIKSRMQKYNSTVFRTNMLPAQFMVPNPKVIVLADGVSFPILFDLSKVEKKNVLDGTFMPSTALTGGYRTCAYLDPSEPKHTKLKTLFLSLLSSRHDKFIPVAQTSFTELFNEMEAEISSDKKQADFNALNDDMSFNFVFRLFFNINPADTKLGTEGPKLVTKWLLFQLHPLITLGLPKIMSVVEDLFLHTFPLPSFLVKSDYQKIYDVIYNSSSSILEEAEKLGIGKEEACHNLVFVAGFNAYGGMKALFPALMKWVGLGGAKLHKQLVDEIRTIVRSEGGKVSFAAIEKMKLTKSVVYEALRIEPPVPYQYAKAKEDLVIQSHDALYQVKKGEMLFGYQPFATKDPKVFENPEEFVATRFVGEEGEKMLKYVYWSNGRETENPTEVNKQCPGKDLVVLLSRLMVVEFFLRYDSFTVEFGKLLLGSSVKVKSLTKATSN